MIESALGVLSAAMLVQACLASLVTLLIGVGMKSLSRGWEEGVPRLAPRSLAYAEILCGIMAVLNVLAAIGFAFTAELAIALFALGIALIWCVGLLTTEFVVDSARKRDDMSQQQARERRFGPSPRQ